MLDLQMKGLKFMVSILITCAPLASLASGWKLWKPLVLFCPCCSVLSKKTSWVLWDLRVLLLCWKPLVCNEKVPRAERGSECGVEQVAVS